MKRPKNVKIKAESQIVVAKPSAQCGFTIENEFNFLGEDVMCNGSDSEAFAPFDDEPKEGEKPEPPKQPDEEKKPFNWLGVIEAVAGATILVGVAIGIAALVSVPAVAVLACAGVGALVCGAVDVGLQYAQYIVDKPQKKDGSPKSFGEVYRLDQTIIAASAGAASAALAATPIGRTGQAVINGAIGGVQAKENGGSFNDIVMGVEAGVVAGWLGGPGYIPFIPKGYSLPASYYRTEAVKAIKDGVEWGAKVSGGTSLVNNVVKKAKECLGIEDQDNSSGVPAT